MTNNTHRKRHRSRSEKKIKKHHRYPEKEESRKHSKNGHKDHHYDDISDGEIVSDNSYRKYKEKYYNNKKSNPRDKNIEKHKSRHNKKTIKDEKIESSCSSASLNDENEEKILEERRLKRQKILEKYQTCIF
ncbi:hypothetical protein HZS_837 [Henneguya salminicola]|nr:hypothetical protein HZS_837 [Henneguya salminicola]